MKFSIRDLLLVTLLVALGVSWWLDHRRLATQLAEYQRQELEAATRAGRIRLDYFIQLNELQPASNRALPRGESP